VLFFFFSFFLGLTGSALFVCDGNL
jgi:hypothetical protein